MDLVRIGDKVVSKDKIYRAVDRILEFRALGLSQADVAFQMEVDRAFISKIETMGEVRRGKRIALIGFPIENKDEISQVASSEGLDLVLLMTDAERWRFVREKSGEVLVNDLMRLITAAKKFDAVIFIGSDMRVRLVEAILGTKVVGIEIGTSPIKEDKYVDPKNLRNLILHLKNEDPDKK
jgi:transcriptional regulator with XRE-family HTH domain